MDPSKDRVGAFAISGLACKPPASIDRQDRRPIFCAVYGLAIIGSVVAAFAERVGQELRIKHVEVDVQ